MKAINLLSHYIYQGIIQRRNILGEKTGGKKENGKWALSIINIKQIGRSLIRELC